MNSFPFPGKEIIKQELEQDPCYKKIPETKIDKIASNAWEKGECAAQDVWKEMQNTANTQPKFTEILKKMG